MTASKKLQTTLTSGEQSITPQDGSLSECVEAAIKDYFEQLDGHHTANLYELLLAEVEAPLLKATLEHTKGNQCRASEILGINRGTLRKKLKLYGLIE